MMPNVAGEAATRLQILIYALLLGFSGILPALLGFASVIYGVVAAGLGGYFVWLSYNVWAYGSRENQYSHEKRLFGYSIIYMFALFAALGIDAVISRMVM